MSSRRRLIALALLCSVWAGCSCDPIIPVPDGGSGGGTGGGATGGGTGGGSGGGATGGGSGGGATGGGAGGGATGGGSGGGTVTQFTQYVHDLIVNSTSNTAQPDAPSVWQNLPDNAPITFSANFFDGGT